MAIYNKDELREVIAKQHLRAKSDPLYFFSKLKTLDEDEPEVYNRIKPFPITKPYLPKLIDLEMSERRLAIYKSRRMIVTWTSCGVSLHELLFKPGSYIGLIAQKQEKAGKLIGRMKFMYDHLPSYWKIGLPTLQYYKAKNAIRIKVVATFANSMEATCEAYPEGGDQLRADGYSLIYWDEVGYCDDQLSRMTYAAAIPALGKTGRFILSSTPPRWPGHFWFELCSGKYLG